jgi:[NiFe] hydrogenase diaphorase moiety large subunit
MSTRQSERPDAGPNPAPRADIKDICASFGNDRHRMLDILLCVQEAERQISADAIRTIAAATGASPIEVEGVASFYAFLSLSPKGRVTIRLCDDIIDRHAGLAAVQAAFEAGLGIAVGQTSADGAFSLECTPCIGMCDQAPAAMINDVVLTRLTPGKVAEIVTALKAGSPPGALIDSGFDDLDPHAQARAMVENNLRQPGDVLLGDVPSEAGLKAALAMTPGAILDCVEASGLRGCGGAGYPAGTKWRHAAKTPAERRIVICNADEGEPGTFKDRLLLTERAHLMFEGMTIAARAVGDAEGILYLRGEYAYLRPLMDHVLADRRARQLLGRDILGVAGFDFDIRIQMGAGAYVCGADGALISSCEGLPGEPKTRPPYPTERGYLGFPTIVNNVETFCHAARILDRGAEWFFAMGTEGSHGTKLFSVCGDCARPGVYEYPYGLSVRDLLQAAGGENAAAVQVGGPSGDNDRPGQFSTESSHSTISRPVARSSSSNGQRNILEIVDYYMSFFVHESCGYCTPCRVGNVFLQKGNRRSFGQRARPIQRTSTDLQAISHGTIIETSRCGLGMTSPNPVLSTLGELPACLFSHDQARARTGSATPSIFSRAIERCPEDRQAPFLHLRQGFQHNEPASKKDNRVQFYDRWCRGHGSMLGKPSWKRPMRPVHLHPSFVRP